LDVKSHLNADLGVFAQDAWTLKRLTVNIGTRWEYFSSEVSSEESGVGRFVPARKFDRIQMPIWKDLAPRFGVVYDLLGNAKTAIKAGINKYEQAQTVALAESFNPLILTSAIVNWTDLNSDYTLVNVVSPLDGSIIPGQLGCTTNLTATCAIPSPTALPSLGTPPGQGTVWLVSRTTRYPADCKGPCTPGALVIPNMTAANLNIPLVAPGTEYAERVNQLDLSLAKWFQLGRVRLQGQLDMFNALNRGDVLSVRSTGLNFLTPSYMQPQSVLQGRIIRIATQLKW
jgi:hypothetical protein